MPVLVSAVLDHATVEQLLGELLPLTVDLGDADHPGRWIEIERPQLLEFVEGRGIRIQTGAKLNWTVASVSIPFTLSSIRFLLAPIAATQQGRLNLAITLEETDFKNVPKLIDRGVVAQLNARLSLRPEAIGWSYQKTLGLRLPLPPKMAPVDKFEMDAGELQVAVRPDSLLLSLPLPMRFSRRPG